MKKFPLLLVGLMLLSGCNKNQNAIDVVFNLDEDAQMQELKAEDVKKMIDANNSFFLYVYSPTCSHCQAVEGYFKEYLAKNPYLIYAYNPDSVTDYKRYLNTPYPNFFPEDFSVPRLMVIKNKSAYTEVNNYRLTNEKLFPSSINSFSKETGVYTGNTLEAYTKYLSIVEEGKRYNYDSFNEESVKEYQEKLKSGELNGYFVTNAAFDNHMPE